MILLVAISYIVYCLFSYKKNSRNDYDLKSSNLLKGIAAMMIIFGHIGQNCNQNITVFDLMVRNLGFIGVSIFLFSSGYGYSKKYGFNNINYKFLIDHFIKILTPYLIVLLFFNVVNFSNHQFILLMPYSWYVIVISLLTFAYYVATKIKILSMQSSLLIISIIIIVLGLIFNFEYYLISQIFSFYFGVIFAKYKPDSNYLKDILILTLFFVTYFIYLYVGKTNTANHIYIQTIIGNISSSFISVYLYFFCKKFIFDNSLNVFLGKMCYWFYLFQAISIYYLFNEFSYINNNLKIIIAIILNFLLTFVVYKILEVMKCEKK